MREPCEVEFIRDDRFIGALVSMSPEVTYRTDAIRLYHSFSGEENELCFNEHWGDRGGEWFHLNGSKPEDNPIFVFEYQLVDDCVHYGQGVIIDLNSMEELAL